jgi:hypothetical protein
MPGLERPFLGRTITLLIEGRCNGNGPVSYLAYGKSSLGEKGQFQQLGGNHEKDVRVDFH